MMDLILWRHAEAFEVREGETDLERALTPKGERQAQRMADWLGQRLAHSTRILVSPAQRCQRTAKALGKKFKTLPELGPQGDAEAVLAAARWPAASEPVLIVGHQPTIGLVAAQLLSGTPQPWPVKKGAIWWIRARHREEGTQVILQAMQAPDCL
jgi:phosphohistidine phosphatase